MESTTLEKQDTELGILNLIVIVLSIYVLGILVVDRIFELPVETLRLLSYIDNSICIFFFWNSPSDSTKQKINYNLCDGAGLI